MDWLGRHLRHNLVGYVALFVALGGTSYAAVKLGRDAVKGPHIARNAVTSAKVKDGSLQSRDFKRGELPSAEVGPTGPRGPQGLPGSNGTDGTNGTNGTNGQNGQRGERGPSDVYTADAVAPVTLSETPSDQTLILSTSVPAGKYSITAAITFLNYGAANVVDCDMASRSNLIVGTRYPGGSIPAVETFPGKLTLSFVATLEHDLTDQEGITISCSSRDAGQDLSATGSLHATRVATVH